MEGFAKFATDVIHARKKKMELQASKTRFEAFLEVHMMVYMSSCIKPLFSWNPITLSSRNNTVYACISCGHAQFENREGALPRQDFNLSRRRQCSLVLYVQNVGSISVL